MSWSCRLVDPATSPKAIGDVWYAWDFNGMPLKELLSVEYERDWKGIRPPLLVRLPGPVDVCLDRAVDDAGGHGWTVRGTPDNLTVSPSVNIIGVYHGFIRDGVITDDLHRPCGTAPPDPHQG